MKKPVLRTFAVLLGMLVLSAAFTPLTAFADELSATDTATLIETETKEMTVLREEFVKHFELPDGTGAAVVYDSPVHYEKDGEWVEIDNTLVAATKVGDSVSSTIMRNDSMAAVTGALDTAALGTTTVAYYENNDNPFKVQLPAAMHKNAPIAVSHGEYTLRFCFDGANDTVLGAVEQPFTVQEQSAQLRKKLSTATDDAAKAEVDKEHAMTAWKNRSAVTFAAVQPNVDLQYHVSGKKLKETLIFNEIPTALSFSFTFTYTGLQAVLQEDNSVHFVDDANAVVFVVDAPYMFDNGEGYSTDITVTVQPTATGCRYTLTPDRAWLTDEQRVYPVTLDPTTGIPATRNSSYIQDAGVQQSNPDTNYQLLDRIYVGSGPNKTIGCMYFNLLQWPALGVIEPNRITGAELRLTYYPTADWQTGHNFTIEAYRLTSAWNPATITWNNSTNIYGTKIDDLGIKDMRQKTNITDVYDITAWVRGHYAEPTTDFGIRLQPATVSSTLNRVCYVSSDYTTLSKRPLVVIYYLYQYHLYLQQYYDSGFAARYGTQAAINMINTYTQTLHDFFLSQYTIKIHSTVSPYVSPADQCTHKSNINDYCGNLLSGVCSQEQGIYHCTNISYMLSTLPSGVTNVLKNQRIIRWTGHPLCNNCHPAGVPENGGYGLSYLSGEHVLVCLGDDNSAYADYRESSTDTPLKDKTGFISQAFPCILAHELGHTLSCVGDGDYNDAGPCTPYAGCIMQYEVEDSSKYANIVGLSDDAYCDICDSAISAYAEQYLR